MRSFEERSAATAFVEAGLNDCEIARRTGIPRTTIRDWRSGRTPPVDERVAQCPLCLARPQDIPGPEYAYLLGQYLGDGHIVRGRRGVYRLRVSCCAAYPGILDEVEHAIRAVRPGNRVGRVPHPVHQVVVVYSYSKHWPCLFPQHGPGRKHERPIELLDWQRATVEANPGRLLRGLVHSDGWRGTNRVTVGGRTYEYGRYQFSNVSDDIRRIFCDACDLLGVEWRQMNAMNISVAKRGSVALLDEFVGPKA